LTYFDIVSKTNNGLLAKTFLCSVIGSVCDEGHFRCHDWLKSPVKCIKESVVCNGYDNCEDKSDEDKELCRGNNTTSTRACTLRPMLYSILYIVQQVVCSLIYYTACCRWYRRV
jgi:hypothetical protein